MQMSFDTKTEELKEQKRVLLEARNALNKILDETLFKAQPSNKNTKPFHWYSEFYNIMDKEVYNGGFDVIIGNPPYVEYSEKKMGYYIKETDYKTYKSKNLYSYSFERSKKIMNKKIVI